MPVSVRVSVCVAVMRAPNPLVDHSKRSWGSSVDTVQVLARCIGCMMIAELPTRRGPASSRRTLVTVGVRLGQASTPMLRSQTRSIGAAISMQCSILTTPSVPDGTLGVYGP